MSIINISITRIFLLDTYNYKTKRKKTIKRKKTVLAAMLPAFLVVIKNFSSNFTFLKHTSLDLRLKTQI